MSLRDRFKARIAASDFQAQGPVAGSITVATVFGPSSNPVTGTFKVKGADSLYSISSKMLGVGVSIDYTVVDGWAYSRTNGGTWTRAPASGETLQSLVGGGLVLTDQGVETKFGKRLHHLSVANMTGVDLSAFGIGPGQGRENLTVNLSFWAEDDGTPAGLSIEASFDQKIAGLSVHATTTLDISIDALSGVTITAPTI